MDFSLSCILPILDKIGTPKTKVFKAYAPKNFRTYTAMQTAQYNISKFIDNSMLSNQVTLKQLGISVTIADLSHILFHLFVGFKNCTSILEFTDAVFTAISQLLRKTPLEMIKLFGQYTVNLFIALFGNEALGVSQSAFFVKNAAVAQGFVQKLQQFTKNHASAFESSFSQRLTVFIGCILTLPLCVKHKIGTDWLGYPQVYIKALIKEQNREHPLNWAARCLDSFLYISERLLDCLKHGSLDRLKYDDEFVLNYKKHFDWHSHYSDKLDLISTFECVNVESDVLTGDKYDWKSYLQNVEKLMDMNKSIRDTTIDKNLLGHLRIEYAVLEKCKLKVLLKLQVTRHRDPPFAMAIIGPPSIGKSQIVDKLLKIKGDIDKEMKRRPHGYDPEKRYNYNYNDKYMSGFTASHTSIVIDDVGQFNTEITQARQGGAVAQLIDFINPNPLITEQAELENKGKIPFLCSEVVLTSNFDDCGFKDVFQHKGGIYRRFIFIYASVRPEFRHEGETRLLGDLDNPSNYDLHLYKVKRFKNTNGNNTPVFWNKINKEWGLVADVPDMDLRELAVFLRDHCLIPHYEQLDRANSSSEAFMSSGSCSGCKLTKLLCQCAKSQAYETLDEDYGTPLGTSSSEDTLYVSEDDESRSRWFYRFLVLILAGTLPIFCYISRFFGLEDKASTLNLLIMKLISNSFSKYDEGVDYISRARIRLYDRALDRVTTYSGSSYVTFLLRRRREKLFQYFDIVAVFSALSVFIYASRQAYLFTTSTKVSIECDGICKRCKNCESCCHVCKEIGVKAKISNHSNTVAVTQADVENDGDDEADYWEVKYQDMTRLSGIPSTVTMDQLSIALERNIMMMKISFRGESIYTNCFGLFGNVALIPKHTYLILFDRDFKCNVTLFRNNKKNHIGCSSFYMKFDQSNFKVSTDTYDYVLVQHPGFGTFRDVRKYMLDKGLFLGRAKGMVKGRNMNGELVTFDFEAFQTSRLHYLNETLKRTFTYTGYKAFAVRDTFVGLCGAPYLVQTLNGVFIGGLHVALQNAFGKSEIYCSPLFKDDLNIKFDSLIPYSFNGLNLNDTYVTDQDLALTQSMHKKSPVYNLTRGSSLYLYGTLNIFRPKLKTLVGNTFIVEDVLQHYDMLDVEYFSPKDVNSRKCLTDTVNKMCVKSNFPPNYISEVKKSLLHIYLKVIKDNNINIGHSSAPLDVAINGLDGTPYINRLPVKTSGGFAHKGRKDKYFSLSESTEEHDVNYRLNDEIQQEIDTALQRIEEGERITAVWDFTFKDEPLSAEKIRKDKCRLFNSASLFLSILERMGFLWCIPLFYGKHRHLFGCAMGANACGRDWTVLHNYIVRFGKDRVIAGDYSSFDKRMEPALILAAFEILIAIAEKHGFPEKDLNLMRAVATEVAYPITNVGGSVVEFFGTNPSGHSLTTIINSIVNILYMMLACKDISVEQDIDINFNEFFSKHMSILTYGDDNIASSNCDMFNHTSISRALEKYGVEYTMADKESDSVPFINILEASFLKRYFKPSSDGLYRAPLEETSIKKMLTVCTYSRSISKEEQVAQIIESACREYFQYGKRKFLKERTFLKSLLDKYNLYGYLSGPDLPTYDQLMIMCYGEVVAMSQSEMMRQTSDDTLESFNNDHVAIFSTCHCIVQYPNVNSDVGVLFRELDCNLCHCNYADELDCPVCSDKENKITQV